MLVDMPFKLKLEAVTAIVGIINFNAFPGRSGEWSMMLRSHVEEQLANNANYLMCNKHKTASTYGALAKHVPKGSFEAFRLFVALPGKSTELFLEPPGQQATKVCMASLLRRFGSIAFGGSDPPNSNLIRKMYHTALLRMSREGDAMRLMQRVDAHSAAVARKVYAISTPADDAALANMLFEEIMGPHVEFPSPEEIDDMDITIESIESTGKKFAFDPIDGEDDDDGDEEEYLLYVSQDGSPEMSQNFVPLCDVTMPLDGPPALMDEPEMMAVVPADVAELAVMVPEVPAKPDKHLFTEEEKKYLFDKAPKDSKGCVILPDRGFILATIEEGKANGNLDAAVTYQGTRSFFRKVQDKKIVIKTPKKEKKEGKVKSVKKEKRANKGIDVD